MEKDKKFYWKLFSSTFSLSAFTFGGGFVIIPLMRKKFVEELSWIDEQEMLDLTAIAQSSPGAIAVNASILIGYRLDGFRGALINVLGTVLPPLIILSVISLFYTAFRDSLIVGYVLRGMQAGVAAVITDVVLTMTLDILKEHRLQPVIILIAAFIAAAILNVNVILIILICGVIGALNVLLTKRSKGGVQHDAA